jgi:SAM-dependent methyltransferase
MTDHTADLGSSSPPQRDEIVAWTEHWSDEKQGTVSQRFFSFYRKTVFARTVQYFMNRYFPLKGVFVEAGSGTSETSIRIDKRGSDRTLVAVDLILPILKRCHPIIDVKVGGDIFHLPFGDDCVDGIWNVGVMEHFTHQQIDQIMSEFHRVLKPGSPILLLWPGRDSIPQRMLRIVEAVVNTYSNGKEAQFRFHPPEISQLKSIREGRDVLTRNGFQVLKIDYGFRSMMAFKTVVGAKD